MMYLSPSECFIDHSNYELMKCKNPSTLLKLADFKVSPEHFQPYKGGKASQALASGSATPLPDYISSTPAWDPSSRTPLAPWLTSPRPNSPTTSLAASTSQIPEGPPTLSHPLLDVRLIGIKLRVLVNGGEYKNKELEVSIVKASDGQLNIRRQHYKSSISLEPDWVLPKHPCPKRDKGLLVVINGAHCGKLVRRVHHRSEGNLILMNLAVIKREPGVADNITDELLELGPESLCVCVETAEEKNSGNAMVSSLRQQARKR